MRRRRAQCDVLVIPQLVSILPHIFWSNFCAFSFLLLLLLRVVVVVVLLLLLLVAGGNRVYCRIFASPKNCQLGGVFAIF